MNILETLYHDMTKPASPAHIGESFFMWTYFLAVGESRALLLVMANHTNDPELKEMMEHFLADVLEPQIAQLKTKMMDEGIILPTVTPDPPKADQSEIPPGAKLADAQIARMNMVKVLGLMDLCYQGVRFSFRSDVSVMFSRFSNHVTAQGYSLRELMLKRGWVSYPPLPTGSAQPRN